MKNIKNPLSLLAFIAIVGAVQFAGTLSTAQSLIEWYPQLAKPVFNPPNWIFAPVWTILYLLIAVSGWMVWTRREGNEKPVDGALTVFAVQIFLNAAWSFLFFGMRSPYLGIIGIAFLWLAIAFNIFSFYRISKNAAYLLLPYIFWVSFAALLNFAVWQLN
ncbi:MAG: TspO/MBR family protein [Candidatus Paceibacterota bacterium]|jgi:tryptophan-rich sensory protein